ncbi:hypothetical protein BKA69DRAFT_289532 [Paraphysoderma sedebokerense]|nr:hypothetical protein BKA69DRAFT_289532 [Paraphysoderma sedebokerense]
MTSVACSPSSSHSRLSSRELIVGDTLASFDSLLTSCFASHSPFDYDSRLQYSYYSAEDNSKSALKSVPSSERPIQYIVYLEPSRNSDLYKLMVKYFEQTKRIKHNEAHMYCPHISCTGFFSIPQHFPTSSTVSSIISILDSLISTRNFEQPVINGIQRSSQTLTISVSAPSSFHESIASFKSQVITSFLAESSAKQPHEFIHIRPKNIDHLSLAYMNKKISGQRELESSELDSLEEVATHILCRSDGGKPMVIDCQSWDLVFYQVGLSSDVEVPHEFTELKRWQVC